jgi:hypothetical protein
MSGRPTDAVRILAGYNYESGKTGTRVEVDVWTVSPDDDDESAIERAKREFSGVDVIDAHGNVAKVGYPGAAGVGYRYIDSDETAPQQAYAGAKRSAGGDRTGAGTFQGGCKAPPGREGYDEVVAHAENEVLPAFRADLRRYGSRELATAAETMEGPRREEEPTTQEPFDGFRNTVRIFPRGKAPREYSVDVRSEENERKDP